MFISLEEHFPVDDIFCLYFVPLISLNISKSMLCENTDTDIQEIILVRGWGLQYNTLFAWSIWAMYKI